MAAIAYSTHTQFEDLADPADWPELAGIPARPDLRVVAGGRARQAVHPTAAVYRRRRLAALVAMVVLVMALVVAVRVVAGSLGDGPHPVPEAPTSSALAVGAETYGGRTGDTVWSIARRLHPNGDIRATVDRIVARNGTATLQPGQRLLLD